MTPSNQISVVPHKFLNENRHLVPLLAKWAEWKAAYANSVLYNYSASKVEREKRVKGCRNTINNTVAAFIENGLAHKNANGHLILTGKQSLAQPEISDKRIAYTHLDPTQDIKPQLHYEIFKRKFKQITYTRNSQKENNSRPITNRRGQNSYSSLKKYNGESEVQISNKGLGRILGTSTSSAVRSIKRVASMGLITRETGKLTFVRQVHYVVTEKFDSKTGQFIWKGRLFYFPVTKYSIPEITYNGEVNKLMKFWLPLHKDFNNKLQEQQTKGWPSEQ